MNPFLFELGLAIALTLIVAWVWRKQEPRRPLTPREVEGYCAVIEQSFPMPREMDRAATLARLRRFGERDDGRDVYMLNLLRFHDAMASGTDPAGSFGGTPGEANALYEANTLAIVRRSGAFPIFAGRVEESNVMGSDPVEGDWSRVILMHYPSRRHFFELLTNPRYLAKADYKTYAMHVALVPVKRELVIPDFRFLAVVGAVIAFLLAAWLHALSSGGI